MINFTRGGCRNWHRYLSKMLLLAAFFFLFNGNGFSQNIISAKLTEMKTSGEIENVELFSTASGNFHQAEFELIIKDEEYLQFDSEVSKHLIIEKPDLLRFSVPFESQMIELDLYKTEVLANGYRLTTSDGASSGMRDDYVLYKGTILNNPNTIATISIFKEGTIISISDEIGNIRIVPFKQNIYTVYRDSKFVEKKEFECNVTSDYEVNIAKQIDQGNATKSLVGNCIEVYFVADYALYQQNSSSVLSTENWIISTVNEVQTLYANEGIPIEISSIFVYTSTDPYASLTSIYDVLDEFAVQTQNAYPGRLAHFLTSREIGGGLANLDVLCSNYTNTGNDPSGPYAVSSGLGIFWTPFPNYSWNVMVIAHEMGHNVGSPHTHSCAWFGTFSQIDDCGNIAGSSSSACYDSSSPIIPASGGTIMSYCIFNDVGVNFNNGFGTEPGNLIFNKFDDATCVTGNCAIEDCMDPWACNYNPSATISTECHYNFGCTDITACNYYFAAVCDDGTCVYDSNSCTDACIDGSGNGVDFRSEYWPFLWTTDVGTGDGTVSHNNATMHIVGNNAGGSNVLTQRTILANTSGTYSFDWCYYTTDAPFFDIAYYINGIPVDLTDGSLGDVQNGSGSFFANAGDLIGFGIESTDGGFGPGELTIKNFKWPVDETGCGCMNPWACNYNSAATIHDTETCTYTFGCTDPTACNADFAATCDDGSCEYNIDECVGYCVDNLGKGVGFRGDYWPFYWYQEVGTGDGVIFHNNSSLHIVGNNVGDLNVETQVYMLAEGSGVYTFDWCYFTQDDPAYDIAYYINGVQVVLTDIGLGNIQNGSGSFFANSGDLIGFGIISLDSAFGAGELTIKNFRWPLDSSGCGCVDPLACNYDSNAIHDPTLCYYGGCTDNAACNYSFTATCDDGSCAFEQDLCTEQCVDASGNGVGFVGEYTPFSWTQEYDGGEGEINHNSQILQIIGNNNPSFSGTTTQTTIIAAVTGDYAFDWNYFSTDVPTFDPAIYINGIEIQLSVSFGSNSQSGTLSFGATAGDIIGFGVTSSDGCCGEATLVISNFSWPVDDTGCGCTDPWACNYDSAATNYEDGSCDYNVGCTDTTACNFDSIASCDDGSCVYNQNECFGYCVDASGDGVGFRSQYWPFLWTQDLGTGDGSISHTESAIHIIGNDDDFENSVLTQTSYSAQTTGDYSFDWCYFGTDGPIYDIAYYINGVEIDITDTSMGNLQNGSITFTANIGDIIGWGMNSTDGCCGEGHLTINNFTWPVDYTACGCMDPWASNYDSTASFQNYDDCEYFHGCTNPAACNYDATAVSETGSCVFDSSDCTADCITPLGVGVDFNAYYAPGNWTYNYGTGNGEITQTIGSMHILGNNNSGSLDSNVLTEASILSDQTGMYTFDWCYFTIDGPQYDIAYFVNGARVDLTDTSLGNTQNGSVSFYANAGDVIAFGIDSTDGCCGYGLLSVSNFTYPSQECCCLGDANNDFIVNIVDLLTVSSNFGCTAGCTFGDADCNGQVTILDLLAVSSFFGAVCP